MFSHLSGHVMVGPVDLVRAWMELEVDQSFIPSRAEARAYWPIRAGAISMAGNTKRASLDLRNSCQSAAPLVFAMLTDLSCLACSAG